MKEAIELYLEVEKDRVPVLHNKFVGIQQIIKEDAKISIQDFQELLK
jgi:predicted RNase H-like HicB family nuclease